MTKQMGSGEAERREVSDEEIERLRRERFGERVRRVLEVMHRERVDWQATPFITPDGRIGTRVMPVELPAGRQAGMAAHPGAAQPGAGEGGRGQERET